MCKISKIPNRTTKRRNRKRGTNAKRLQMKKKQTELKHEAQEEEKTLSSVSWQADRGKRKQNVN